jgi:hypothetical protein
LACGTSGYCKQPDAAKTSGACIVFQYFEKFVWLIFILSTDHFEG